MAEEKVAEKTEEKKVSVNLSRFVTFKGVDYPPGVHEVPADFADRVVRKKLGELTDQPVNEISEFEPLSLEETMNRFGEGDSADIVFQSLKFHQPTIVAQRKAEMENKKTEKSEDDLKETTEGIPADFPMRHIFVKHGFKSVAEIQAKTKEELVALDGIADASADKALAYGKN